MEEGIVLGFLLVLLLLGLPIAALVVAVRRTSRLEQSIAELRSEVARLSTIVTPARGPAGGVPYADAAIGTEVGTVRDVSPAELRDDLVGIHASRKVAAPDAHATPAVEESGIDPKRPPIRLRPVPEGARLAPAIKNAPVRKRRTSADWEALLGGQLLNRIGALALIIGVGFFLKYAFDKNWITETTRVLIGAGSGVALLMVGVRTGRKGYQTFAQGLIGAGVAILYLSIYASFNFYHLIPQLVAFALMSLVTAITFSFALRHNSLAVALLGWAGGFLTPVMLSTGTANHVALFTYIALLNAGLIAIASRKREWVILDRLAILGTAAIFVGWYDTHYLPAVETTTLLFLGVFWLEFFALDVYRLAVPTGVDDQVTQSTSAGSVALLLLALASILEPHGSALTMAIVGLGAMYLSTYVVLEHRPGALPGRLQAFLLTSIALGAIACAVEFSYETLAIAWALGSVVVTWFGIRRSEPLIWGTGTALALCSLIALGASPVVFEWTPLTTYTPLFNRRALAYVTAACASMACGLLHSGNTHRHAGAMRSAFGYAFGITLFGAITVETIDWIRHTSMGASIGKSVWLDYLRTLTLPVLWIIYGALLVRVALQWRRNELLHVGIAASAAAIFWVVAITLREYVPIGLFTPILNARVAAVALVIGGIVLLYRMLGMAGAHSVWTVRSGWKLRVRPLLLIAGVLLLLELLTAEGKDLFQKLIAQFDEQSRLSPSFYEQIQALRDQQQLTISAIWLVYSALLMAFGIARRIRALRIISFFLFGFTILKIFIYDLSFLDTLYRIFSFIGLGLILLTISFLFQKFKDLIFGDSLHPVGEPARAGDSQ